VSEYRILERTAVSNMKWPRVVSNDEDGGLNIGGYAPGQIVVDFKITCPLYSITGVN
jgi:hypothetical protein